MVDGTDFWIQEPMPFNPKWYSDKFKGPGLCSEIGVCIKTRWIVWVTRPFPAGEWLDHKKLHGQELIIIWMTVNIMWEMKGIMMDNSGLRHLLDTTILNKKCMSWLGHVMKLLTGASNALGACLIYTGIH